jgi:hypothetical protein
MSSSSSSGTKRKLDAWVASYGNKRFSLAKKKTVLKFKIPDFVNLTQNVNENIETDAIFSNGYDWYLQVQGNVVFSLRVRHHQVLEGNVNDNSGDKNENENGPIADVAFIINKRKKRPFHKRSGFCNGLYFRLPGRGNGFEEKYLDLNGSFNVDFELQIYQVCDVWYPKEQPLIIENIIDNDNQKDDDDDDLLGSMMFQSPEFSDITFIVGSNKKEFKAHKIALAIRAKTLLELALEDVDEDEDCDSNDKIAVRIPDVDEKNFEILLRYVYTKELESNPKTEEDAMVLLKTADRFGITDLKIYVESVIIDAFLVAANAGKMLPFADSYSCAYLKEASMDKYVEDPTTVTNSSFWRLISESNKLLSELLQYTNIDRVLRTRSESSTNTNSANANTNTNTNTNMNVDHLTVASLRCRLEEKKLELDGTRKTLVDRLKNHLEGVAT